MKYWKLGSLLTLAQENLAEEAHGSEMPASSLLPIYVPLLGCIHPEDGCLFLSTKVHSAHSKGVAFSNSNKVWLGCW